MSTDLIPRVNEIARQIPSLIENEKKSLISATQAVEKMPAVVDEVSKKNAYELRDKITDALNTYHGIRMPITRGLDAITKEFTSMEGTFKKLIEHIDAKLNEFATIQLAKQREEEAAAQQKIREEQERIEIEGRIRQVLSQRIKELLFQIREAAGDIVEKVTEENIEIARERLTKDPNWTKGANDYYSKVPGWADTKIFNRILNEEIDSDKATYLESAACIMSDTKSLLDIALVNKEEAKKLQAAELEREKEVVAKKESEEQARIEAEKALAVLDIDKPIEAAASTQLKIQVVDNKGWLNMIALWYEHDPESKTKDLSKKTFAQCKLFAERIANTDGLLIDDKAIKYVEVVKAKR
jgi:hypothetical protein